MAEEHLEILGRAAVSMIPMVGGPAEIIYSSYRERATRRGMEFLDQLREHFHNPEALNVCLAHSDPVAAVFDRALRIALESGLAEKRAALGKVVAAALQDEAAVDRAGLLIDTLGQVDAPHIRAMIQVRQAVDDVKAAGGWPKRAPGGEHEILTQIIAVGRQHPDPVLRTLKTLGLIYAGEATDEWYVHDLTPYGYELLDYLAADEA